jgi:hypothetical protein
MTLRPNRPVVIAEECNLHSGFRQCNFRRQIGRARDLNDVIAVPSGTCGKVKWPDSVCPVGGNSDHLEEKIFVRVPNGRPREPEVLARRHGDLEMYIQRPREESFTRYGGECGLVLGHSWPKVTNAGFDGAAEFDHEGCRF